MSWSSSSSIVVLVVFVVVVVAILVVALVVLVVVVVAVVVDVVVVVIVVEVVVDETQTCNVRRVSKRHSNFAATNPAGSHFKSLLHWCCSDPNGVLLRPSVQTQTLHTGAAPHQPFAATNSNGIQMYRVWPQNIIPHFAATNSNGNQNSNFIPNVSLLRTPWDSNVSSVASKPQN